MKEIWAIFNGERWDRIVFRNWWFYRQECYYAGNETVKWRDVPFFRKRKS